MMSDGGSSWVDVDGRSCSGDAEDNKDDWDVDYDSMDDVEFMVFCLAKCSERVDDLCSELDERRESSFDREKGVSAVFFLKMASSQLMVVRDAFMAYGGYHSARRSLRVRVLRSDGEDSSDRAEMLELLLYLVSMVCDGKYVTDRLFLFSS
jgi:hypothetical protein